MSGYRYHGKPNTMFSAATVRDAVRKFVAESDSGRFEPDVVTRDVLRKLGVTDFWSREGQATQNQVRRALDTLAGKGELIKYGRKDAKPGLKDFRNRVYYYTPEGDEQARAATAERRVKDAELRERWAVIYDMLTDTGMTPLSNARSGSFRAARGVAERGDVELSLSIEDWERFFAIEPGSGPDR